MANADEGVQLRVSEITAPVIILSPAPTDSEIDQIIKYSLIPSVSDLSFAREFQKRARKAGIRSPLHVEVDTGMGRGGTLNEEAFQVIREIASFPNLAIEGIFTHFSESEIFSMITTSNGVLSVNFWRNWKNAVSASRSVISPIAAPS